MSFHDNDKPYIDNTSSIYRTGAIFIWPGSDIVGTPKQITVVVKKTGNQDGSIMVYDPSTDNTICEYTTITWSESQLLYLTSLSNIPTNRTLLEIQLKHVGLSAVAFEF